MKRWQACCLAVELVVWSRWSIALAEKIPSPEALEQLGARPVTLSVIEPHQSTPEHPVAIDYLAFPAPVVISAKTISSAARPPRMPRIRSVNSD